MKYVISSKLGGKNYLLDTEDELESALVNHVRNADESAFAIRKYKPDIDTEEIFKIYLKLIEDQILCKDNSSDQSANPQNENRYKSKPTSAVIISKVHES
jgi:hypothetical protein